MRGRNKLMRARNVADQASYYSTLYKLPEKCSNFDPHDAEITFLLYLTPDKQLSQLTSLLELIIL